jgi:hypothetical protein
MIPGRNHCNNDWKFEYNGKLASGYEGEVAASQYVCVDSNPEVFERSDTEVDTHIPLQPHSFHTYHHLHIL